MKRIFYLVLFVCVVALANAKQPEPPVPGAVVFNTCDMRFGIYVDNYMGDIQKVPFRFYFHSKKKNEWVKNSETGDLKVKEDNIAKIDDGSLVYTLPIEWGSYDYFAIEILPAKFSDVYKEFKGEKSRKIRKETGFRLDVLEVINLVNTERLINDVNFVVQGSDLKEAVSLQDEVVLDFDYDVDNYARFIGGQKGVFTLLIGNPRVRNGEKPNSVVSYFRKSGKNVIGKLNGSISGNCKIVLNGLKENGEYKFSGCNKKTKKWKEFASVVFNSEDELVLADSIPFDELKNCLCFMLEKDGKSCDANYKIDSANKKIILSIEE